MKSYDLPDSLFDDIFRKASRSEDYPYSEEAWDKMEIQLSRWERINRDFWRFMGVIILFLSLVILFIVIKPLSQNNNSGIKSNAFIAELSEEHFPSGPSNRSIPVRKVQEPSPGNNKSLHHIEGDASVQSEIQKMPGRDLVSSKDASQYDDLTRSRVMSSSVSKNKVRYISSRKLFHVDPEMAPLLLHHGGDDVNEPSIRRRNGGFTLSLELSIGPDLSSVAANQPGIGTFTGIYLELGILKRLKMLTGLSHARKRYSVQDEYTPPYPGFWTNGQVPYEVDVACHVIDIPINFRYEIIDLPDHVLFLGSGLSSYLMLTEEYYFNYGYTSDPNLVSEYELNNENQHYFGIVNLSAGYTRYFNSRWAWQFEPYYKMPIQDIAAAKVRLNSFGVLIGLKYSIY